MPLMPVRDINNNVNLFDYLRAYILKPLLITGLLIALTACQSNQTPFVPQAIKKPGDGRIYVYWPGQRWGEKSGKSPQIQIDGIPVGVLRYKSYLELELKEGRYQVRMTGDSVDSNWDGPEREFQLPLDAGEIVYVRLLVKYDQQTNSMGHGMLGYSVTFLPRAEKEARLEIHGLRKISD